MANFVDPDETPSFVDPDEVVPSAPTFREPTAEAPKKRTMTQEALRQLGLTARAGVTGLTGASALLADLPVAAARAMGANVPLPSQAQQQLMTRLGLPEPETGIENVAQLGATMLAGGRDPLLAPFARAPREVPLTPKQATAKQAIEEGYKMLPSQLGKTRGPLYALERVAGEPQVRESVRQHNANITMTLARRAIGLPDDAPLIPETLKNLKATIYDTAYAPIDKLGKITTGRIYRQQLDDIERSLANVSESFPAAARNEIKQLVQGYRVRDFDAADARLAIANLREQASKAYAGRDAQMGKAAERVARAIEDAIDMNLAATGQRALLTTYREGRKQFARIYDVERALHAPDEVSAVKLAAKLSKGAPLTDELKRIAQFGQQFPYLARPPAGTQPQPLGIARRPTAEAMRAIPRHLLLSGPAQRRLIPQEQVINPSRLRFAPATYNYLSGLFGEEGE